MFIETWRRHWDLSHDPFACEDADKDVVLRRMETSAVHSAFERLHGDPTSPAPGIVFGEKGSGKSGLRLAMGRRVAESGRDEGEPRVLVTEYTDFDTFLERFRRAVGAGTEPEAVGRAVSRHWTLADHLDAMLSLGVTGLADRLLAEGARPRELSPKQRAELLLLVALYHDSRELTTSRALGRLRGRLRMRSGRPAAARTLRVLLTLAGLFLVLLPLFDTRVGLPEFEPAAVWQIGGLALVAAVWLQAAYAHLRLARTARSARHLRVLARDPKVVADALRRLDPATRKELTMPVDTDQAIRFDHLNRFASILRTLGYESWYVLFDRIDEPSALNADPEGGRRFVETMLDHKLLQVPILALKLFLPIELDELYRNAPPEELKRMRLDKSNLVPNLDWTGQELVEIANQRVRAVSQDGPHRLDDFLDDDLDMDHVRATLQTLGTPRYALGFLSSLFTEYARNLPGDLPDDSPEWRVPRAHFDVVRAQWLDRASLLRRKLN